ncbi:receptor-like protein 56 isoform X2 [Fagus crenata]
MKIYEREDHRLVIWHTILLHMEVGILACQNTSIRHPTLLPSSWNTKKLGTLNKLEQLYLDGLSIDKSFLHEVGVTTSLNVLKMRNCGLNGSLPAQGNVALSQLSCLTSLEYLSLLNNDFLDPIKLSCFFNLSNLKVLLNDNNKIAFEPNTHSLIPAFQLKVLNLFNGSFNGFNRTTPRFLQYQYDLRVIDLSHNNLVGKFPNWLLENNTRLEVLILKDNSLNLIR